MQLETKINICIPRTPNFIRIKGLNTSIDIAELSDHDLHRIADQWTKDLMKKAAKRRKRHGI